MVDCWGGTILAIFCVLLDCGVALDGPASGWMTRSWSWDMGSSEALLMSAMQQYDKIYSLSSFWGWSLLHVRKYLEMTSRSPCVRVVDLTKTGRGTIFLWRIHKLILLVFECLWIRSLRVLPSSAISTPWAFNSPRFRPRPSHHLPEYGHPLPPSCGGLFAVPDEISI